MKRNLFYWLLIVMFAGLTVYVLAQQLSSSNSSSPIDRGIGLYEAGEYQEAKDVLSSIGTNDPVYDVVLCYRALCLNELNEKLEFLKATSKADLDAVSFVPDVRERLAHKEIEVLLHYRKFEDILPKIQAFEARYPVSTQLTAVAEFRMATLFERGMKKAHEATIQEGEKALRRWGEGQSNLVDFLSLAGSFPHTNYTTLARRDLPEDIYVALLTLGDEEAVLASVSPTDETTREEISLLRLEIKQTLEPERIQENLDVLWDFLEEFPNSKKRNKVEFDIVSRSFEEGKRLCREADEDEFGGDAVGAAEKRVAARAHFDTQRSMREGIAKEPDAGIDESDLFDLRKDLLQSYWYEHDYEKIPPLASSIIAESSPGDLNWMLGTVFQGIALMYQTPQSHRQAAKLFDEVLTLGFGGKPDHDDLVRVAASWQFCIARMQGDDQMARQITDFVLDGKCTKNIKAEFMNTYGHLLDQ